MDLHEFIKQQQKDGYIDEKGKPLKCECGCTDFTDINEHFCQFGREEYQVQCNNCKEIVGHWAFGYWQVN